MNNSHNKRFVYEMLQNLNSMHQQVPILKKLYFKIFELVKSRKSLDTLFLCFINLNHKMMKIILINSNIHSNLLISFKINYSVFIPVAQYPVAWTDTAIKVSHIPRGVLGLKMLLLRVSFSIF